MFDKGWEQVFESWLLEQGEGDPAHGLQHIKRVVHSARSLAKSESASLEIVIPAAWLHDCVHVPKDSKDRSKASRLCAERAVQFLSDQNYPEECLDSIHHAIAAHSFSAKIEPETIEAKVLQDADRLDAIGAIGLSRCLMLGGYMQSKLYSTEDPFCKVRKPDDRQFAVDHFFAKLLTLGDSMKTTSGKDLAAQRTEYLLGFLQQLGSEIGQS